MEKKQAKLSQLTWTTLGPGGTPAGGVPQNGLCATEASTHLDQHPVAACNSCSALRKSKDQNQNEQHQARRRKSILEPGDNQETGLAWDRMVRPSVTNTRDCLLSTGTLNNTKGIETPSLTPSFPKTENHPCVHTISSVT